MEKKNLSANHTKTESYEVPIPPPPPTPDAPYETLLKHLEWLRLTYQLSFYHKKTTQIGRSANYWEAYWEQIKI